MSKHNLIIILSLTIFLLLSLVIIKFNKFQIKTCDIDYIRMIFEKYNKECDKILDINIKFNNHKIIYSK